MNWCTVCGEKFEGNICPHCGENGKVEECVKIAYPSKFDGSAITNGFMNIAVYFACLFTLGIAFPFMVCWKLRWKCSHTYINGRRLAFDGTGGQLIGNYLLWLFLSFITLGIYFVVVGRINIIKWQTKHTHFEGLLNQKDENEEKEESKSEFNGHWYQLLGVTIVSNLVTWLTLGFGRYWASCYKERWYAKHKSIDGHNLFFNGTAMQYFKKCFVRSLLIIVTLGIYSFWYTIDCLKWQTAHTRVELDKSLPKPTLNYIIRN